jgi:hypothetical protein
MRPCPSVLRPAPCVVCVSVSPLQVMPSWSSCGHCVLSARRSWKQAAAPLPRQQLLSAAAALQLAALVLAQQGQEAEGCCPALQEVRKCGGGHCLGCTSTAQSRCLYARSRYNW